MVEASPIPSHKERLPAEPSISQWCKAPPAHMLFPVSRSVQSSLKAPSVINAPSCSICGTPYPSQQSVLPPAVDEHVSPETEIVQTSAPGRGGRLTTSARSHQISLRPESCSLLLPNVLTHSFKPLTLRASPSSPFCFCTPIKRLTGC